MRYEAEITNSNGPIVRDHNRGRAITGITETEAEIIAFALNAVAEGKVLCACAERYDVVAADFAHGVYDGPTEGVAP